MMRLRFSSLLFVLPLSLMVAPRATAEPVEPRRCTGTTIAVAANEPEDFPEVCRAGRDAAAFLATVDLPLPDDLFILTATGWVGRNEKHSLARYDCRTHAIRILNYDVAAVENQGNSVFGVAMTPALWRSFIVHEIVHAAVHPQLTCTLRTLVKTEYIAYAIQFATLPERERTAILSRYPDLSGFDDPETVGETYYALDPARFAVNAYLHYIKPDNGAKFIRRLLQRDAGPKDSQ